ncbi:PH domain-containing protein [Streptomyces polyrhachis]|uniref:PH domain-containing protein n=1 Tax=Streptomyces polyrhachis TaxID=1282885 RepID=A0ABW2GK03_9ACTN
MDPAVNPPSNSPANPAAPGGPPALPVTFRPTRTRLVLLTAGAAACALICVISFLLPLGPGERSSFILTGLLILGVLALLSRPHVTADAEGVTVTNLTHRRRLAWAQIVAVHLRPGDPWVTLDLSDGTSLPVMGIQPGIAREHALHDARALRALVQSRGTAAAGA